MLVVEDDPEISRFLVQGLTEERYVVDLVEDGAAAIDMVAAEEYDAIVLDLMLPGVDGFEVCRRLRARGADTPMRTWSPRTSSTVTTTSVPMTMLCETLRVRTSIWRSFRGGPGRPG